MNKKQLILTILIIGFLLWVDPVYAGPGGYIAKGLFNSWWGKILLSLLGYYFAAVAGLHSIGGMAQSAKN